MCSHSSVEFRALQTKLLSRSRLHDSGHIQAFKPLQLNHGRSCLVHAPTTVQTTTRSLERCRPSWGSQKTNNTDKGRCNTQKGKKMQNLVVLSLILSTIRTQLHGYGGEQVKTLRSTRSSDANSVSEFPLRNDKSPVSNVQICCFHCSLKLRIT